jgi:hypothetical protein
MANKTQGSGYIKPGGDKNAYLGHFRKTDVLKRGHNQGAPPLAVNDAGMAPAGGGGLGAAASAAGRVKPTFDPSVNPVAAARQSGLRGAALGPARAARQAIDVGGVGRTARLNALSTARGTARSENLAALAGQRTARRTARSTEIANDATAKQTAVGGAKAGLQSATAALRTARQGLRSSIKGGDVTGAGTAFGTVQSAKSARKTARQGVRAARKAKY